ncbi:hypothetical protein KESI111651_05425 [Kerstersia similis]
MFEPATSSMASTTPATPPTPGVQARAAVNTTHATVLTASKRFLAPWRSASAPRRGAVIITRKADTLSADVQANVAHAALFAIPLTK